MKIGLNCNQASTELKEKIISYFQDEGHEVIDLTDNSDQNPLNQSKWTVEKEWTVIKGPNCQSSRPHAALMVNRLPATSIIGVKENTMTSVRLGADLPQLVSMANEAWIKPALYRQINYKTVWATLKRANHWKHSVKKWRENHRKNSKESSENEKIQ